MTKYLILLRDNKMGAFKTSIIINENRFFAKVTSTGSLILKNRYNNKNDITYLENRAKSIIIRLDKEINRSCELFETVKIRWTNETGLVKDRSVYHGRCKDC